jgi:hypothetical protein
MKINMKKYIGFAGLMLCAGFAFGQATIMPSKPQKKAVTIVGANIHTGVLLKIENFDWGL